MKNINNIFYKESSLITLAILSVIVSFYTIITTLNRGISCDEGFYLLGYSNTQTLGVIVSDFHHIVRFYSSILTNATVMDYRYMRLLFNTSALFLFGLTSFYWIKIKRYNDLNFWLYLFLIILGGFLSFTYASPTISFDHLQQIYYLILFSFFFSFLIVDNWLLKISFSISIGFHFLFMMVNYLPSSILAVCVVLLILLLENRKDILLFVIFVLVGFVFGIIFYNNYIHNLFDYYLSLKESFLIEIKGVENHDNTSLIINMFVEIFKLLSISLLSIIGFHFYLKHVKLKTIYLYLLQFILTFILFHFRNIYQFKILLFILPINFIFSLYIYQSKEKVWSVIIKNIKTIVLFWIFLLMPFAGVFGTNQPLYTKSLIFFPFCIVSFFLLKINHKYNFQRIGILYILIAMLFFGYFFLGNFSRYHYYHTPRSSKYELIHNTRFKNIKLNKYERDYYADLYRILMKNGLKPNDSFLAFAESQIPVYMFGGHFHGGLVYHWHQYTIKPIEKPKFIIMTLMEEDRALKCLTNTNWDYPNSYNRIEMRCMSENLVEGRDNTVIYCKK